MKYSVFIIEKRFFKWEINANSEEEAEYLAKKFFTLTSEREEHFLGNEIVVWSFSEKDK